MSLIDDALKDLDLYRTLVIKKEIPIAIKGDLRYLAALGLSIHTEILGGMYRGHLEKNSGKNYKAFITEFFPKSYTVVDSKLHRDKLKGLYTAIRCGLVHEYLNKDDFIVVMDTPFRTDCAIVYNSKRVPKIRFVVKQYFEDFKTAFNKYYEGVKKEPYLVAKLECALESIGSKLPRSDPNFTSIFRK